MIENYGDKWDGIIENYMNQSNTKGLSISVIHKNDIIYEKGFGFRDAESKLPMTPATIFGIGSISKTFTALACMLLEKEGKLDLDQPVKEYLNVLPEKFDEPICIKHLLSHTTGFAELSLGIGCIFQNLGINFSESLTDSIEYLFEKLKNAKDEILYSPGEKFMYQNEMFQILAEIVEKQSNMPFEEYVEKNIFKPLDMTSSSYKICNTNNIIKGYTSSTSKGIEPFIVKLSSGCGGIFSTVQDVSKYVKAYYNNSIIPDSIKSQVFEPRILIESSQGKSYGLGWFVIDDFLGKKLVYHGGDILYSGGLLVIVPDEQIGIIIGQNTAGNQSLFNITKGIIKDLLDYEIAPQTNSCYENTIRNFIGTYYTYLDLFKVEIGVMGQSIVLKTFYPGIEEPNVQPLHLTDEESFKYTFSKAIPMNDEIVQFILENNQVKLVYDNFVFHKK